jgi:hypothetical protein
MCIPAHIFQIHSPHGFSLSFLFDFCVVHRVFVRLHNLQIAFRQLIQPFLKEDLQLMKVWPSWAGV